MILVEGGMLSRVEVTMMKSEMMRRVMTRAWKNFRTNGEISFSEALTRAWISEKAVPINEALIAEAKAAAGVTEETKTWHEWYEAGFEVIHGSKALFGAELIWGSKGAGATYKARFFGASQVVPVGTQPPKVA